MIREPVLELCHTKVAQIRIQQVWLARSSYWLSKFGRVLVVTFTCMLTAVPLRLSATRA
jgi:hypothetical protein